MHENIAETLEDQAPLIRVAYESVIEPEVEGASKNEGPDTSEVLRDIVAALHPEVKGRLDLQGPDWWTSPWKPSTLSQLRTPVNDESSQNLNLF